LRWQDFCRALRQKTIKGQKEKFLCESFAKYLEESDMAYRDDITKEHLNDICTLLNKITSGKHINIGGKAFNYTYHCLEFLRDVRASVLERIPKLNEWMSWGPFYIREASEEGEEAPQDLAFSFGRKWSSGEPYISGRIRFPPKGNVQWVVLWGKYEDPDEIPHSIGSVSSPIKAPSGRTVRALDADKMAKTFVDAARKMRIV
jgi:hypothetical protein